MGGPNLDRGRSGARVLRRRANLVAAVALWLAACGSPSPPRSVPRDESPYPTIDIEVYHRAETDRAARLAQEVERLQADLQRAEEALVLAESGLRGDHSRADAVSNLAEARIRVERATVAAPWRPTEIAEARAKLAEAERQVEQGHFGAALFFVYRARRVAETLEAEAKQVYATQGTRFVKSVRVNLRAGPSTEDPVLAVLSEGTPVFPERSERDWLLVRASTGSVGWVHASLLGGR